MSNFITFRLLWSSISQTLSIHYVSLNPYQLQSSGSTFKKQMSDSFFALRRHTFEPISSTPSTCCPENKLSAIDPPIFLKRNRREAKQIHKQYGMVHRVIPVIGTVVYQEKTEDVVTVRKTRLQVSEEVKVQAKASKEMEEIRNKRFKIIMDK
jgi:hypothetical protein